MQPDLIATLKALTEPTRIRIAGALAAGPRTPVELAAELELPAREVHRQLGRLRFAGLVDAPDGEAGAHELRLDALAKAGRALDELDRAEAARGRPLGAAAGTLDGAGRPADDAKVLRSFVRDGRLTSIPAQHQKRSVVLRFLREQCFADDRDYPEKEVNQRLALWHPDVASLRRSLVDEGLMTRSAGVYRRADPEA